MMHAKAWNGRVVVSGSPHRGGAPRSGAPAPQRASQTSGAAAKPRPKGLGAENVKKGQKALKIRVWPVNSVSKLPSKMLKIGEIFELCAENWWISSCQFSPLSMTHHLCSPSWSLFDYYKALPSLPLLTFINLLANHSQALDIVKHYRCISLSISWPLAEW